MQNRLTWAMLLEAWRHERIWMIFLLGVCSGYPWVLIGSAMSGWLTDAGLSRSSIGYFGSIFFAYTINFLWAPLIDRYQVLGFAAGNQRKSWIISMLIIIGLCSCCFYFLDPNTSLVALSVVAMTLALCSATQDIAIDAYRVDSIDQARLIPLASAATTSGWWTGYAGFGALAFYLKGETAMQWSGIFLILGVITFTFALLVLLFVRETHIQRHYESLDAQASVGLKTLHWLRTTLVNPFSDLVQRHGLKVIILLLLFLVCFKLGEAFLGRMSITFYKEIGYTDSQIATYSKLVTWGVTIFFTIVGAMLNMRFGIFKGLMIGGIAMASTNLMFAWIARVGPSEDLFLWAVLLDGFTSAMATVALVSFITFITNKTFSASQYALLASIANMGRTLLSTSSGSLVDALEGNWSMFFIITTVMIIPGLLILTFLFRALRQRQALHSADNQADAIP